MGNALNFISDGTTEINLLDTKAIFVDGWVQKIAQQKGGGYYSGSALADGSELVLESVDNVVEELPLYIRGKDPDQIAAAGQILFDLGYKLRQYWVNGGRQTSPVYWGYRPKDQTNIQYALLKNYRIEPATETHGHSFKGFISKPATFVGTLFLERESYWRDGIPGTLPTPLSLTHPDAASMATIQSVADYRNTFALTHIYNFDASAATFSGNQIGNAAFTYFPSPAAVNDIVYFGSTQGPFFDIVPFVGTAGAYNATLDWQIWTGAAWVALTVNSRFLQTGSGTITNKTGKSPIRFNPPSTWSRTVINGVNAYWVRVNITFFTSMATNPTNITEVVYAAKNEYIEIDSTDLIGDVGSLLRLLIFNHSTISNLYANMVMIGAKSRGLSTFASRLNWTGFNNPSGWTTTLGGPGVSTSLDGSSPNGERLGVTFTGAANSNTERVRLSQTSNANAADWFGEYQLFVICNQVGGSVGDVKFQVFVNFGTGGGSSFGGLFTDQVSPQRVGTSKEIIGCGRLKIPFEGTNIVNSPYRFNVALYAESSTTTPTLFVYQIVLMPIDEYAVVLRDHIVVGAGAYGPAVDPLDDALVETSCLVSDGGVVREETAIQGLVASSTGNALVDTFGYVNAWETRGASPVLTPRRTTRLYFLFGDLSAGVTGSMVNRSGMGGLITIYSHDRYYYLRGDT